MHWLQSELVAILLPSNKQLLACLCWFTGLLLKVYLCTRVDIHTRIVLPCPTHTLRWGSGSAPAVILSEHSIWLLYHWTPLYSGEGTQGAVGLGQESREDCRFVRVSQNERVHWAKIIQVHAHTQVSYSWKHSCLCMFVCVFVVHIRWTLVVEQNLHLWASCTVMSKVSHQRPAPLS